MPLDRTQLEAALTRAADLDSEAADRLTFDSTDVSRISAELGISSQALTRALAEQTAGERLTISSFAMLRGSISEVVAELATYFRLRGLVAGPFGVWEQRSGWWPDVYRFRALTPIAIAAGEADLPEGGTNVTLTAGLDRIWRVHVLGGILGFLVALMLTVPMFSFKDILVAVLLSSLVPIASVWTYQRRRQSIGERLRLVLEGVERPAYRLTPW